MAWGEKFPFCSQGLETEEVSLFSDALRANWARVLTASVGRHSQEEKTSEARQAGEKQGKRKEVPGERPRADRPTFTRILLWST